MFTGIAMVTMVQKTQSMNISAPHINARECLHIISLTKYFLSVESFKSLTQKLWEKIVF